MVAPSIFSLLLLLLLLLSPLLFLHSAGECPESFDCGDHNLQIGFPLSNTTFPKCGLYTVNCTGPIPKLNLGAVGLDYRLRNYSSNSLGNSIRVFDFRLNDLISFKSCDVFALYLDWTLPITPSISFTVSPSLSLYKCTTTDDYFRGYDNYTGCRGYTVYINYSNRNQVSNHSGLPRNCTFFAMPVVSDIRNRNSSDFFSVLASEFNITFHESKKCLKCRREGGQCARDSPVFKCLKEKKGRSRLILILVTAVGIGGFVLLLSCYPVRHLALGKSIVFWKNKTEDYRNIEAFLKNCGSLSPKRYTYSDVKKMIDSFRIKLGQGGYGCVFKGKLENGSLVAVKVLKGLKGSGEDFINEVATISRTSHVNIVTLLGFCFDGGNKALIYEFMPNGSLDKFIHDRNSSTYRQLGWDSLYKIAVGIARGLEYLHRGCNTRILHFDIKPHNILLDEDFCPKISDFGLAKLCPQKESIVSLLGARGTAGYIAPEVFCRNFGEVSHKSDVYSYGMMVLEMVGGRKNISVEVDRTSEIYFPHWIYKRLELDEELGLHGIVDEAANGSVRKMVIVGLWCIQTDPSHRPSMGKVVEMLEGSLESLQIPPKPFLSSPSRSPVDSSTTIVVT